MAVVDDSLSGLISEESNSYGVVDEGGLLPGNHEATETFGDLGIPTARLNAGELKFDALTSQTALIHANLTSDKVPLFYEVSLDGKNITAKQGANGPLVFDVELFKDGSYHFTLHSPLDRESPKNLVKDPNFDQMTLNTQEHQGSSAWSAKDNIVSQHISTHDGAPYQLSLSYGNAFPEGGKIELFWNDRLVNTFQGEKPWTAYLFSVDGSQESELKIVGHDLTHPIAEYLHEVKVTDSSSQMLPLDFCYSLHGKDDLLAHSRFTVNVGTEPPVMISQHEPMTIVYDQAAYQSIVVNSETHDNNHPLTTLNLDSLFSNLNIAPENRHVNIVQLQEHGAPTNIYEVHIADTHYPSAPIAIANVHLMFNGGEGGLDVFYKNVTIEN